ncbi:inorganic phosphate transporter [Actinokineospora globicatena]|uniref:Inorganic phosphate transporter n=1 Tax=Actinokineospora globicatena TaxID=103729 RepID=A0A9W6QK55_9PSEU|nr:inorganic phosphate transporter [Actinokineospora globicatena]MCP2303416.1 inorganic phosphate transporter, PiT family [Actinokineospora globicatena]GLW79450.1 inorganic phosphate transporter [Actinokineospora globicatena]GLW86140.1 inorganic phosphate transporter [Actinokineospora globicatena]GLW90067.1 inorganic phosphate transporter [Actinokineospora globicatena]
MEFALVIAVVVIALAFDYTNGFHDAANAIATSISTRALTPKTALLLAAVMNLVGALVSEGVASTIGSGIISPPGDSKGLVVVLAGLIGAITWNLITWWRGLPSSSSHALIGGLIGAGLVASVTVHWSVIVGKVLVPMVVSPLIGFCLAYAVMVAIAWLFRRGSPSRVNRGFRTAQSVSAAALAFGHGLQDAQKTMGVIVLALATAGLHTGSDVPLWVKLAAATAIALGTYAGGWRIMRTLGRRVIKLDPARGVAADLTASSVLYVMAIGLHAPVSTTHTISSAIMGVGATRRLSAVRWGVAGTIVSAWILTIPMSALFAGTTYAVLALVIP